MVVIALSVCLRHRRLLRRLDNISRDANVKLDGFKPDLYTAVSSNVHVDIVQYICTKDLVCLLTHVFYAFSSVSVNTPPQRSFLNNR